MEFKKAERKQAKVKICLVGPSYSGKTYSALLLAKGISDKIAFIDTERGSASLYANEFSFNVIELPDFSPETYIKAIKAAVDAKFEVVVIDSISHEWQFILEQVDSMKTTSKNQMAPWAKMTPRHNAFIETILQSPIHVICTTRAKTEWAMNNEEGKNKPVKVGLGPRQRAEIEYEFTVVFNIDASHFAEIEKDRTNLFSEFRERLTPQIGERIRDWLSQGIEVEAPKPVAVQAPSGIPISIETFTHIEGELALLNLKVRDESMRTWITKVIGHPEIQTENEGLKVLKAIRERATKKSA